MLDSLIPYLEKQAQDTDIFCFQEAADSVKERCAHILSQYKEISDYKYIAENDSFPTSVFVKKDIELLSSGTLMAHDMDRGLAVYVEVKVRDESFYICNVHGRARPPEKRDTPGRLMLSNDVIGFFKNKDKPIVIGGDFNLFPDTASIQMFKENGYRDLIEEFNIDTTRNKYAWQRYPVKMLYCDYAFINDKVRLKSFTVPKNEISDHLPLIVEIDNGNV